MPSETSLPRTIEVSSTKRHRSDSLDAEGTPSKECILSSNIKFVNWGTDDEPHALTSNTVVWPHWKEKMTDYDYLWTETKDGVWHKFAPTDRTGGDLMFCTKIRVGSETPAAGLPKAKTAQEALEDEMKTLPAGPCALAKNVSDAINREFEQVQKQFYKTYKNMRVPRRQKLCAEHLGPKVVIFGIPDVIFRRERNNLQHGDVSKIIARYFKIEVDEILTPGVERRQGMKCYAISPEVVKLLWSKHTTIV